MINISGPSITTLNMMNANSSKTSILHNIYYTRYVEELKKIGHRNINTGTSLLLKNIIK